MRETNAPRVDARYWTGMLAASLAGTTLGDFVSTSLGFGYVRGLPLMIVLLGTILLVERRARTATQAFYWSAVVMTRTAATNIADLGTHELKLGYVGVASALAGALFAAVLLRVRSTTKGARDKLTHLPATGPTYWLCMLIASTLGTTLGDFMSEDLSWGLGWTSLGLGTLVVATVSARRVAGITHEAYYWSSIVLIRTAGTTMGDFLSGGDGLRLGFGLAAGCSTLVLVVVLVLPAGRRAPRRQPAGLASGWIDSTAPTESSSAPNPTDRDP